VDATLAAISGRIRGEGLMPGDRLPSESALASELSVSRPVVREALRSLAALGMVDLGSGRRAVVRDVDPGPLSLIIEHGVHTEQISVPQVYDVRRTIEVRIAALAAIRRSGAEADRLTATAQRMRELADDPPALMEADIAFHNELAAASRNQVFALIVGAFRDVTRQTWPIGWTSRTSAAARDRMLGGHLAIAAAVARQDPAAASAAMALHFDESLKALVDAGLA
jgi:DNA-binding FadR family transcriptional regulator